MQQNVLFHDFTPKPKMTIAQFRDYCAETEVMGETPSLQTVINLIEEGHLRAVRTPGQKTKWLIFQESAKKFFQQLEQAA